MKSKYFTVEVKPTIAASKQALAAFADGDLLFDWTSFQIPRGPAKLVNATIVSKSADGAVNSHALNLYFAKTRQKNAPVTLGVIHATALGATTSSNEIIGACQSEEADALVGLDHLTIQSAKTISPNMVLEGEPNSRTLNGPQNIGFDTLYVAGISVDGAPTFASTVTCTGVQAITQAVLTVGTTAADDVFAVGDVLHDEDDRLLGTVDLVVSATEMKMRANLENATVNAKDVYCINPIRLILSFEK